MYSIVLANKIPSCLIVEALESSRRGVFGQEIGYMNASFFGE
jgi:hypothetical protein